MAAEFSWSLSLRAAADVVDPAAAREASVPVLPETSGSAQKETPPGD